MNTAEIQLRTAAFGGFQKQDVLNYIEAANREHQERMEALKRELEEVVRENGLLKEEQAEFAARESRLTERIAELEQDVEAAKQAAATQEQAAELGRQTAAALEQELTAARVDLEQVQAEKGRLEPLAQSYEGLKERTAGIELEAHQRAEAILAQAQAKADEVRRETEAWLQEVQAGYGQMGKDLTATVSYTNEELARIRYTLEELDGRFTRQSDRFNAIVAAYQQKTE